MNPLKDTVLKQIASLAKFLAKPLKQGYVRASDAGVFQHPQFKDVQGQCSSGFKYRPIPPSLSCQISGGPAKCNITFPGSIAMG